MSRSHKTVIKFTSVVADNASKKERARDFFALLSEHIPSACLLITPSNNSLQFRPAEARGDQGQAERALRYHLPQASSSRTGGAASVEEACSPRRDKL